MTNSDKPFDYAKTILANTPDLNNFAGIASFMRLPFSQNPDPLPQEKVDVGIWGIPLDTSTSNRPGARFGPRGVRQASTILANNDPDYPFNFNILKKLKAFDCGDARLDYGNISTIPDSITAQADYILTKARQLLTIGGDHYITYPLVRSLAQKHGEIALVQFDAHQDTWEDEEDRIDHGTFVTKAIKQGIIDPLSSIQIGIRTHASADYGIQIINGFDMVNKSAKEIATHILARIGNKPAYLTFDIDCLDPAYAPGTGTPVCGGPSTAKAQEIILNLVGANWIGADVVEVAPAYDNSEITALAAASIALTYLGIIAQSKSA